MREIRLDGYIDEEVWFGDEFTPQMVRDALYGEKGDLQDDVHITLNSYGGSVNAATKIHDEIQGYPGQVRMTISGTAASAATMVAMAADELNMTPGSMFMIHDPSMWAMGNVRDMEDAIRMLNAHKDAILNTYETRCKTSRETVAQMMADETWMDSKTALEYGFVDAVASKKEAQNSAGERVYDKKEAEKRVRAWYERKHAAMQPKARDEPKEQAQEPEKVSARERKIRLQMMKLKG